MPSRAESPPLPEERQDDERQGRRELAAVSRELYAAGLLTPSGGNLSVLLPGEQGLVITPSGLHKGRLSADEMILLDRAGRPAARLAPGTAPSVETPVHLAVYRGRADVRAVVHGHPVHATAVATLGLRLEPVALDVGLFADPPVLPFIHPGSEELARSVAGALARRDVVLLAGHGAFAVGPSLEEAAARLAGLEHACRLFLLIRQHAREGGFPPGIPPTSLE